LNSSLTRIQEKKKQLLKLFKIRLKNQSEKPEQLKEHRNQFKNLLKKQKKLEELLLMLKTTFKKKKEEALKIKTNRDKIKELLKNPILKIDRVVQANLVLIKRNLEKTVVVKETLEQLAMILREEIFLINPQMNRKKQKQIKMSQKSKL